MKEAGSGPSGPRQGPFGPVGKSWVENLSGVAQREQKTSISISYPCSVGNTGGEPCLNAQAPQVLQSLTRMPEQLKSVDWAKPGRGLERGRPPSMITLSPWPRPDLIQLAEVLANLLGAERADSIQAEAEDHPVLFAQAHVEGRKLGRYRAAVPRVPDRNSRVDQRAVTAAGPFLEVEEERRAAE